MLTTKQKIEDHKNRLISFYENSEAVAHNWKINGGKVMGYLCSYVPEEILFAAGVLPLRILGHLDDLAEASAYFQPFVCRLIRSALDKGLTGKASHLDGLIVSYTCDGMRMLYDTWEDNVGGDFTYLLDLPSALDREPNLRFFQRILQDFTGAVGKYTGRKIEEEKLRSAITVYNRYRRLSKELHHLKQTKALPLSSADILKINLAGLTAPKDEYSDELEAFLGLLKDWLDANPESRNTNRVPLHVSGSVVVDPFFYEVVDEMGGTVASDDLCTGTRYFWDEVREDMDPMQAISQRYLSRVTCPSKYPAQNRPTFLMDRIQESGAVGVIILGEKFCDPHLFDIPAVRTKLETAGVSTLWLETELVATGREQLTIRLETFLDVLRRKQGSK